MDPLLYSELLRDEGRRLTAYKDSVGLYTIGVGHLLGDKPRMTEITIEESDALMLADIGRAEQIVSTYIPHLYIDDKAAVRYRALINMAFNLGHRLGTFIKFLNAVDARDWATAGREMMDSTWAKQVGDRAIRLRHMIETGTA